ncbi:MAG TPA: lipase maturation factor family protein, partial [Opitutus sp.]|nr:lipase maturation factor family protein [Opitutus sp.]
MTRTAWAVAALVAVLSVQPVVNLLSSRQIMNTSFDPLELVNTYGAFGSVGQERLNVVFEGTDAAAPDEHAEWKPYPYQGLPVRLDQRPLQIAPWQLRLDWQMWFAAMSDYRHYPWTLRLVWKLLHNDAGALSLFASNPFPQKPPRFVRAVLYRYKFAPAGNAAGDWWTREPLGEWLPPLSTDDERLREFLRAYGWLK